MLSFQPDLLGLLMAALVAWRLASFLVYDRGPWRLAVRIRSLFGVEHDEDGEPTSWPGSLFMCVACLSFWTAGSVYAILLTVPEALVPGSIWAAASLFEGLLRRE